MTYREKRALACQELLKDFRPNLKGCRDLEFADKVLRLVQQGLYSHEIAELTGKTPKAVQKFFRRYNFPDMHNFFPPLREERLGWKGGIKIVKGYEYSRTPGHPHATKHGNYVAVHRLVMEKKLGRYLLPTEVVDHIDRNTRNNHPDNLRVFQSNAEHLHVTLTGRCPNWSDEGKTRLDQARRRVRQKAVAP